MFGPASALWNFSRETTLTFNAPTIIVSTEESFLVFTVVVFHFDPAFIDRKKYDIWGRLI